MSTINEMRDVLMHTLNDLRNPDKPIDIDRAKAIAQVASVMVESAKVEVDFMRVTGGTTSAFLKPTTQPLEHGVVGVFRHSLGQ